MQNSLSQLKNSVVLPLIIVVVLGGMLLFSNSNVSVLDWIADRVVDRMESKYSPYGPQSPKGATSHQQPFGQK